MMSNIGEKYSNSASLSVFYFSIVVSFFKLSIMLFVKSTTYSFLYISNRNSFSPTQEEIMLKD